MNMGMGTYILIAVHQLRADLPQTSQPYTTMFMTLNSESPWARTKLHPGKGIPNQAKGS